MRHLEELGLEACTGNPAIPTQNPQAVSPKPTGYMSSFGGVNSHTQTISAEACALHHINGGSLLTC